MVKILHIRDGFYHLYPFRKWEYVNSDGDPDQQGCVQLKELWMVGKTQHTLK